MPGGRPPLYTNKDELEALVNEYFESEAYIGEGDDRRYVPTVSGLAYHLDMTTETLRQYEGKDEFSVTIKKAKQRIEMNLEQNLRGQAVTGTIFNLKNNFGWKDKTETDNTTHIKVEEVERPKLTKEEWLEKYGGD